MGELARDFVTDEQELPCGYAPRTIQYSLASDTLFVGCKDGTVTVVDGLTGDGASSTKKLRHTILSAQDPDDPKKRLSSVRALVEWCPDWLLIGRDDGHIHLVNWREVVEKNQEPRFHSILPTGSHRVSYLEWLDPDFLLVSLRNAETCAVRRRPQGGRSVQRWAADAFRRRKVLPGLKNLVSSVPFGKARTWLQISKDGTAWITTQKKGFSSVEIEDFWQEVPGFVTDFAAIKPPYQQERESTFDYREQISEGVYISTDTGVYLVNSEQPKPRPQQVALPGVGRMCLAITYFADSMNRYLWVSDSAGDAHLFWSPRDAPGHQDWQRSGIRHDASQVTLGFSSWRTLAGHFVVGQARRNNIVVSRYRSGAPDPDAKNRMSPRWLLRHGDVASLRDFVSSLDDDAALWEPETQLAEVFEHLGEDPEQTKVLREFLRNPDARLAQAVLKQLRDPERSGQAVELWTSSLLGTVHRYRGSISEKESLHLGIIRWLRQISALKLGDPEQEQRVRDVVQDQIVIALKWGVFGTSYTQWRNAALPSKVLEEQKTFDPLDHYAYESFLFQRQVELEAEDTRGRRQGRTAWDLRTLRVDPERYLVAVSWIWGGIELYQLSADRQGTHRFDLCAVFRPSRDPSGTQYRLNARNVGEEEPPPPMEDLDFGHCRAIVLGTLPGEPRRYYLLASPAQQTGQGGLTRFELWPLDLTQTRVRVEEGAAPFSAPLRQQDDRGGAQADESVYSLLQVEPGLILAGLRGHKGIAQVTALTVSSDPIQLSCLALAKLTASSPEGKSIARNSIWALAQASTEEDSPAHVVFAGCGDGQILSLRIPRGWRKGDLSEDVAVVGRLGAPVWALASQTSRNGSSVIRRVFAGGADGTILGWQQLGGAQFTPVWATWEGDGPIARIHTFEPHGGEFPMVLAVTQQGRAILFADRADVEPTGQKTHHRRPRVPGERCGRILLEASAFASELEAAPISNESENALARLLSATNDGRLQVHALRYPFHLPERRDQYGKLVRMWLEMVCGPRRADSSRSYRNHRLRCAEVAYLASPIAPQVLVRGLLEHAQHSETPYLWQDAPPRGELHRQWVPRYLRPLLDLDRAWDLADKMEVRQALELALERAWRWNDRELFVEIVTVILNRSNHWICGTDQDLRVVADVYHEILDGLERSLKRWLGSPERAEIRTRITFAKQLTDGDTLWRLGQRAESSDAAKSILRDRLAALQALLVTGDPLLALETLRAANLAMIRLCRRLVEDGGRATEWRPENPGQEVPWNALDAYVRSVSDFAAGAFHLTQRVSDSLAHEIARAFALTVCCCPSSAIRIGHWLSEADLVSASARDDRAEEVLKQFKLLESLGVPVPEEAIHAFRWACRGKETLKEVKGRQNQQVLAAVRPFEHIQAWLSELARQLSSDASKIDLWKADGLYDSLWPPPQDDEYSHSREFWRGALLDLIKRRDSWKLPPSGARDVQPEIVLFSRELTAWCKSVIADLNERLRLHDLFQPQHSDYLRVLRQLEQAADEFPQSAAIQKNIVIGILGHGLLESLDEHVLELEEIAQALDPLLVWEHRARRESGRGILPPTEAPGSRAEHFARHLLARSLDAESIPKNLRSLQGLLDSDEPEYKGTLQDLFTEFWPDLEISPKAALKTTPRELRFLRLALKELDQNDRRYGPWPRANPGPECTIDGSIHLRFPLRVRRRANSRTTNDSITENLRTLRSLRKYGLQQLVYPKDHRDAASHGTGLYLANLAAAVVGWRLTISMISPDEDWFSFKLDPVYEGVPDERR